MNRTIQSSHMKVEMPHFQRIVSYMLAMVACARKIIVLDSSINL